MPVPRSGPSACRALNGSSPGTRRRGVSLLVNKSDVTLSETYVTLSETYVTLSETRVTLSETYVTLSETHVTLSGAKGLVATPSS